MAGVFWRGADGNVWVKGHKGTNAAGRWDNNTYRYWSTRGFSQIADPNPPRRRTPALIPRAPLPPKLAYTWNPRTRTATRTPTYARQQTAYNSRYAAFQRQQAAKRAAALRQQAIERKRRAEMLRKIKAAKDRFAKLKNKRAAINAYATKEYLKTRQDKLYDKYYNKAYHDAKKQVNDKSLFDKMTGKFGSQLHARGWAQRQQAAIQVEYKAFEDRQKKAIKKKGWFEQQLNQAIKNRDQAAYDKIYKQYENWAKLAQANFEDTAMSMLGRSAAYDSFSGKKLNGWFAKFGSKINARDNLFTYGMGKLFDHTLGSGNAVVPSLVTLPARAATSLTNLTRKKGDTIHLKDGTTKKYTGNAWLDSYQQTNLNYKAQAIDFNSWAINKYKSQFNKPGFTGDPLKQQSVQFNKGHYEAWLNKNRDKLGKEWKKDQADKVGKIDTAADWALDPLSYFGAGISKTLARKLMPNKLNTSLWTAKEAAKKPFTAIGNTKAAKWLGAEHKTASQKYFDVEKRYRTYQAKVQDQYWKRFNKASSTIKNNQYSYRFLDDLAKLSDDEAAILQRMEGNKFAARDFAFTKLNKKKASFLRSIQEQAQRNAEIMRVADDVKSTRFKGRYYAKSWVNTPKDKNKYNFRLWRKNDNILGADDLRRAQIERYMMSSIDDVGSPNVGRVTAAQKQLKQLQKEYDLAKQKGRPELEKAYKNWKSKPRKAGRSLYHAPMAAWKASVLALRPAWYVNNFGWNQAAGLMAAGPRYITESAKHYLPNVLKKARQATPDVVGKFAEVAPSKGNPLWRGASYLEDSNRLAAYNAMRKNGKSHKEALKRVDQYFFNYKHKNWERPLVAAMPFWSWTKGTAKLATKMPFKNPRAALTYNRNEENNQREWKKVPKEDRWMVEGRQYIGKDKKGDPRFMNTPWNPMSSSNFDQVSMNPFLSLWGELSRNRDFYGNALKDKTAWGNFQDKFPQAKLYKSFKQAMNSPDFVKYLSENPDKFGLWMTKERQGRDKNASNYTASLDSSKQFMDDVKGFLGKPKITTYDRKRNERENRLTALNDKFFATDWDKKYPEYTDKVAAQKKLAKSYGFDLQKDLYDGLWSKNDSTFTSTVKVQKQRASEIADKFYDDYGKQKWGTRGIWTKNRITQMTDQKLFEKNPFLAEKMPKWYNVATALKADTAEFWKHYFSLDKAGRRALMDKSPQYDKFNYKKGSSQKKIDYLAAKASGDWSDFNRKYGFKTERQRQYYLAKQTGDWSYFGTRSGQSLKQKLYLEAKKSGDWSKFYETFGDTDEYKKNSASYAKRRAAAIFWQKFFAADEATQDKMLKANPQYDKFKDEEPKTQEEWDKIMLQVKQDRKARLAADPTGKKFFEARKKSVKRDFVRNQRWMAAQGQRKIVWK